MSLTRSDKISIIVRSRDGLLISILSYLLIPNYNVVRGGPYSDGEEQLKSEEGHAGYAS